MMLAPSDMILRNDLMAKHLVYILYLSIETIKIHIWDNHKFNFSFPKIKQFYFFNRSFPFALICHFCPRSVGALQKI